MIDIKQFHGMANEFLQMVGLSAETFADDQDTISIKVEERFSIHFCVDQSGSCFFLGDRLKENGTSTAGFHREWLMANQISSGALHPVTALNEAGELTCWVRLPRGICEAGELVEAFDVLVDRMDQLTQPLDA
jgi:hypothetical protein